MNWFLYDKDLRHERVKVSRGNSGISEELILCSGPFTKSPAGNHMFKVNNKNTRRRCEIYSKLTIKIPENAVE